MGELTYSLSLNEAYGQARPDLICEITRKNFADDADIEPDMVFEVSGPHVSARFLVNSLGEEVVVADMNHPLAGERLHFHVEVTEVREASAEELAALRDDRGCAPENCGCCGTTCD